MDFDTLKIGFRQWLENTIDTKDTEKLDKLLYSDKSIFMLSDEFKEYVQDEYNVSSFDAYNLLEMLEEQTTEQEAAMDISDEDAANDEASQEEAVSDEPPTMQEVFEQNPNVNKGRNDSYYIRTNSKNGLDNMQGIISNVYGVDYDSDEGKAISEQLIAQNPDFFVNGADNLPRNSRLNLIDATNILGLSVPETISMDSMEKYSAENGVQFEDAEFIHEILNELLSDSDFKDALDLSKDGEIGEDELKTFLDAINSYDSNSDVISLKDVLSAVEDIGDGTFRMKTEEEIAEVENSDPETIESQPAAAEPISGQQGVSAVPGSYTASGSSGVSPQRQTHDANGNPILENMTLDELKSELSSAQGEVSAKQSEVENAQKAKEENIGAESELKQEEEAAYQKFADELDEENKQKLDEAKNGVDTAQQELDANTEAIAAKEQEIVGLEGTVSELDASLTAYNTQLSALEASKSSLQSKDDPDGSVAAKIAEIESKIAALKEQISEIQEQKTEAETKLTNAQGELADLQTKNADLQEALQEAQENLTAVEDEICEGDEELQALREEYDQKREEVQAKREECDAAIQTAQDNLKTAQEQVEKIEAAIAQAESVNDIKENYATQDGSELIELAAQFEGMSESEVEAICGYNLPDGLWCAAFVKYIATETYGAENLPDWYKNCNYNSCSEILNAAKQNGAAFTDATQAQPGDMIIFNTGRGQARHIGYVVSIENGVVTTIEGNTSSKVGYRTYNVNDTSRINSYVRLGV